MTLVNVLAIGRSGLLYDAVREIENHDRYHVAAIVTDDANAEYDIGVAEFTALASDIGAELLTTRKVTAELVEELTDRHDLQIGVSANWRFLVPGSALALLPHGVLNLHLGRLPDYKGNATVNWAILNGEAEICADVHRMVPELDAGDVLARGTLPLGPETYVGDVLEWARQLAPELFLAGLDHALDQPTEVVVPGSRHGLRCYPRLPQDAEIDWARPAEHVARLVRASGHPYPGAFSTYQDHELRVWRAAAVLQQEPYLAEPGQVLTMDATTGTVDVACGEGSLRLQEIEVDGRPTRAADALRSLRARLGGRRVSWSAPS